MPRPYYKFNVLAHSQTISRLVIHHLNIIASTPHLAYLCMASTTTSPARTPLASPPSAPSTPVKPKRRPPRYKNPETAALRTRCRTYLDETDYSLWSFTDFWGGDEAARVSCQEMWHRELLRIINADKDPQRAKAAVVARNKYKQVCTCWLLGFGFVVRIATISTLGLGCGHSR